MPEAITKATLKQYRHSDAVTDLIEFPDRGHSLTIDSGWREVADACLTWLAERGLAPSTYEQRGGPTSRRSTSAGCEQHRQPREHDVPRGVVDRPRARLDPLCLRFMPTRRPAAAEPCFVQGPPGIGKSFLLAAFSARRRTAARAPSPHRLRRPVGGPSGVRRASISSAAVATGRVSRPAGNGRPSSRPSG